MGMVVFLTVRRYSLVGLCVRFAFKVGLMNVVSRVFQVRSGLSISRKTCEDPITSRERVLRCIFGPWMKGCPRLEKLNEANYFQLKFEFTQDIDCQSK